MGLPASAAVHSAEVFTPLVTFEKTNLSPSQISTMRKFARPKQAARKVKGTASKGQVFVETARTFKTLGGDNCCEAQFSAAKLQLRRQNMLGRGVFKKANVALLAGQYQSRSPGLSAVLAAFQIFRVYHMDRVGLDPFQAFEQSSPWDVLDLA